MEKTQKTKTYLPAGQTIMTRILILLNCPYAINAKERRKENKE